MLSYKNILVATDLSGSSEQVARCAYELAQTSGATLNAIHILEHSPIAYGGEFSIPIDVNLEQTLEHHAREGLAQLGDQYHIAEQNQYIGNGSVKWAVVELADEIRADLIVVGTHGHHGMDVLLGSRANAILHNAKCDVWVVRVHDSV